VFDTNVFINCPFDAAYRPLLDTILFCVTYSGLTPRLATESADGGENRLDKIARIAREIRYSIHDLSRCQASKKGEIARMNMPFELGLDYGLRVSGDEQLSSKKFLVLDEKPYRLQKALSDINGWDPVAHLGDVDTAREKLQKWLKLEAGIDLPGPSELIGQSLIFAEWKYGQPHHNNADVDAYEPFELITAMQNWNAAGRPEAGA
jgi:hypothetical protein